MLRLAAMNIHEECFSQYHVLKANYLGEEPQQKCTAWPFSHSLFVPIPRAFTRAYDHVLGCIIRVVSQQCRRVIKWQRTAVRFIRER